MGQDDSLYLIQMPMGALPRHHCSPDGTWQVVKSQICPLVAHE